MATRKVLERRRRINSFAASRRGRRQIALSSGERNRDTICHDFRADQRFHRDAARDLRKLVDDRPDTFIPVRLNIYPQPNRIIYQGFVRFSPLL